MCELAICPRFGAVLCLRQLRSPFLSTQTARSARGGHVRGGLKREIVQGGTSFVEKYSFSLRAARHRSSLSLIAPYSRVPLTDTLHTDIYIVGL